jgi:hypothetical protein
MKSLKSFRKTLFYSYFTLFLISVHLYTIGDCHLAPIEIPTYNNERCDVEPNIRANKTEYVFYPVSSIVGMCFVGIWFAFILIAKIMFSSSDQYKISNRYDLVIFKPATKTSLIGPRLIYSNNNVNMQNINAAAASGFDVNVINQRKLNQAFQSSLSENSNSFSSLNKTTL